MSQATLLANGGGGGVGSADVTASRAQVLSGYRTVTTDSGDEVVEGTMPTHGGATITPNLSTQTVSCSGHYMTGNVVVNAISPTMGAQTITPTTSAQTLNCSGYYMTGNITIKAKPSTIWNPTQGVEYIG